jgi:hypothetical protein
VGCGAGLDIIIIIFLNGLGCLTRSGMDVLPSFPGASTISSSSRSVAEGVFQKSGVVHSLKVVDPVLFVFGSHVLYCGLDILNKIKCIFPAQIRIPYCEAVIINFYIMVNF